MLKARPNMNGNTVDDFRRVYTELANANKAVQAALASLGSEVMHGRNYQTGQTSSDRDHDLDLLTRAQKAANELKVLESFLLQRVAVELRQ